MDDPTRMFNLDDSCLSMCGMTLGRTKCIIKKRTRDNKREPKFSVTISYVTLMPFVSGAGQCLTPGTEAKYLKLIDAKFKMPSYFLPKQNYSFMRRIVGVDTDIFYRWALNFIDETLFLRRRRKREMLVMDCYASHVSYKIMSLLRDNFAIFVDLAAHTSHVLQPLDVGSFSPFKEEFRLLFNRPAVISKHEIVMTYFLCVSCKAYQKYFVAPNVIGCF